MWGGGKWIKQDKVLPGVFHRFLSGTKDGLAISARGAAAIGLELDWGPDGEIVKVENTEFQKNTRSIFGYGYDADALKPVREIFKNAVTLYYYRLNGGGEKATSKWATAKYTGTRGNDLKTVISAAVDAEGKFDVETYLAGAKVDTQRVAAIADLKDNDFLTWKKDAGALTADAGTGLTGGTNGTTNGEAHQAFLNKAERVFFHTLGCNSSDSVTISLYIAYTKRMCDEVGKVFQLIVPGTQYTNDVASTVAPDNYNVIVLQNKVKDAGVPEYAAIYWALGAHAGVPVNKTLQNKVYDGEYTIDTDYTLAQLNGFISDGKFAFHETGNEIRVLADINSFVTLTEEEQADFKNNASVRVFYQQVTDIAAEFNRNWQGMTPNNADGRSAFRGVVIKYLSQLQDLRAIQDFDEASVTVEAGETKGAVVLGFQTSTVNAMYQLYCTITVQ